MYERNALFYSIVDILPVHQSVTFFLQEDDDILESLLGGITDFIKTLESDTWKNLKYRLADHLDKMYLKIKHVLSSHRLNFGH